MLAVEEVARAIRDAFMSGTEFDLNCEPGNVTDALYAIAHSIRGMTQELELMRKTTTGFMGTVFQQEYEKLQRERDGG